VRADSWSKPGLLSSRRLQVSQRGCNGRRCEAYERNRGKEFRCESRRRHSHLDEALKMIEAGANRLGTSASVNIIKALTV